MPPENHTFRPIIWFFYSLVMHRIRIRGDF